MTIHFYKYQGTGNDFVILDNRDNQYSQLTNKQIQHICDRRFGIGADGLMLLQPKQGFDFEMIYFNADGKPSSMCGNGGRCLVKFAYNLNKSAGTRAKNSYHFLATDGEHYAEIEANENVKLKMQDVHSVKKHHDHFILNTGSPHYVKPVSDIMHVDIYKKGKEIRYSDDFEKEGINVNFIENLSDESIYVRTYERGVENETLSCGTGVTAAALISAHNDNGFNCIKVKTKGGDLNVEFEKIDDNHFRNIWLIGPAELVFTGCMEV